MEAVITEGSGILYEELINWAEHYVITVCDYIYCGQELWHRNKWAKQIVALRNKVMWLTSFAMKSRDLWTFG